jgi:hypothetical protein
LEDRDSAEQAVVEVEGVGEGISGVGEGKFEEFEGIGEMIFLEVL